MRSKQMIINAPTPTYINSTWAALAIGILGYLVGLWNADIQLNEKGFYFAIFLLGMFSAVTLQKTIRDQAQGIPVTKIFMAMSWSTLATSIVLLVIGLVNATISFSEKGFYAMAFTLCLFAVITVQKNIRDLSDAQMAASTTPAARQENID
jgi:uncharacterized membrane protein YiaA